MQTPRISLRAIKKTKRLVMGCDFVHHTLNGSEKRHYRKCQAPTTSLAKPGELKRNQAFVRQFATGDTNTQIPCLTLLIGLREADGYIRGADRTGTHKQEHIRVDVAQSDSPLSISWQAKRRSSGQHGTLIGGIGVHSGCALSRRIIESLALAP